jgi:hypothetical protein
MEEAGVNTVFIKEASNEEGSSVRMKHIKLVFRVFFMIGLLAIYLYGVVTKPEEENVLSLVETNNGERYFCWDFSCSVIEQSSIEAFSDTSITEGRVPKIVEVDFPVKFKRTKLATFKSLPKGAISPHVSGVIGDKKVAFTVLEFDAKRNEEVWTLYSFSREVNKNRRVTSGNEPLYVLSLSPSEKYALVALCPSLGCDFYIWNLNRNSTLGAMDITSFEWLADDHYTVKREGLCGEAVMAVCPASIGLNQCLRTQSDEGQTDESYIRLSEIKLSVPEGWDYNPKEDTLQKRLPEIRGTLYWQQYCSKNAVVLQPFERYQRRVIDNKLTTLANFVTFYEAAFSPTQVSTPAAALVEAAGKFYYLQLEIEPRIEDAQKVKEAAEALLRDFETITTSLEF